LAATDKTAEQAESFSQVDWETSKFAIRVQAGFSGTNPVGKQSIPHPPGFLTFTQLARALQDSATTASNSGRGIHQ
jgi:hypothetical protein